MSYDNKYQPGKAESKLKPTCETPESEKMIVIYGDDCFGDYKIEGKFIDYKKPIKKGKKLIKSRFCTFNKDLGKFTTDHYQFHIANGWEYKK